MTKVETHVCEMCSARVVELRRGRCWGCYHRWVDERPVGLGAACSVCADRRHAVLKSIELLGAWVPICQNCSARTMRLKPLPQSLAEIRSALTRERRALQRRQGQRDARAIKRERREYNRRDIRRDTQVDAEVVISIDDLVNRAVQGVAPDLTAIRPSPFAAPQK